MSEISRRDFMTKLGLGVGALSILPAWFRFGEVLPFRKALFTVPEMGIVTPNWIVAETLTAITRRLNGRKFDLPEYEKQPFPDLRLHEGESFFTLPIELPDNLRDRRVDLTNLRERHIEPVAAHFAAILDEGNFTRSGRLELPQAVEFAAQAEDEETRLNLRFIRAFSVEEGCFLNRFDVKVRR